MDDSLHTEQYFVRYDYPHPSEENRLWLSTVRIVPQDPQFVLQILHGVDEHKGRYLPFMEYVARHGGIVVCHDRRGHGESVFREGLGYPGDHPDEYALSDIDAVYASVYQPIPDDGLVLIQDDDYPRIDPLPRYLLGFSMGSLEAAAYLGANDTGLAGCFFCGMPHREPFVNLARLWVWLLSLCGGESARPFRMNLYALDRYNAAFRKNARHDDSGDRFRLSDLKSLSFAEMEEELAKMEEEDRILSETEKSDPNRSANDFLWLSEDEDNRKRFAADPLCGADMTIALFRYLLRLVHDAYKSAYYDRHNRTIPLWFFSGEHDPIAGGEKHTADTVRFFRDIGYNNVENRLFPHMRHEIFEDADREAAYQAVTDAIDYVNDTAATILCDLHRAEAEAYTEQFGANETEK